MWKLVWSARHDENKCQTENKSILCIEFFIPSVVEHRRQRNTWNMQLPHEHPLYVFHAREEPWRFGTRWLALPGVSKSSTVESLQIKTICTAAWNGLSSMHNITSNPGRRKFICARYRMLCHNARRKWIISKHTRAHDCIWINLIFGSSSVCNERHASILQSSTQTAAGWQSTQKGSLRASGRAHVFTR